MLSVDSYSKTITIGEQSNEAFDQWALRSELGQQERNSRYLYFSKIGTNQLPHAIGTINLPERQINGSSYNGGGGGGGGYTRP